jgi:hypothetical protein
VERGMKIIPGELYFMIKIPATAFFISKEGRKKTGAILYEHTRFKKKKSNPQESFSSCQDL